MKTHTIQGAGLFCGAAALLAAPQSAAAQAKDLIKLPQEPLAAAAPAAAAAEASSATLKLGPFALDGSLTATETYSDNIFVTKNHTTGDWITSLAPNLIATLGNARDQLNLRAGADIGRYANHPGEDYEDFYLGADGRIRLDKSTSLFGGARYDWEHEARESPDAENGLRPTRYGTGDYYLGVLHSFPKVVLRAGATLDTFAFDNTPSSAGLIDNGGRDRAQYQVGARISYRLTQTLLPFLQAYWDKRDYDRAADPAGYQRSSSGYRVAGGIGGAFSKSLRGDLYAGVIGQSYRDPRFADITTPDVGARLTWTPTTGTTLTAMVDRSVEETTLAGASGYLRTAIGGSVEQQVRPDLYIDGHIYYSSNAYQGVARTDHVSDAGIGLKYFFAPRLFVGAEYALLHRASNSAEADFYENRISIRLGAQIGRGYSGGTAGFVGPSTEAPGGFYIGALAGHGLAAAAVDGPRGSASKGGFLTADFGARGWQEGLAAGYGVLFGRGYLGAEVDGALASQEWRHDGSGGTRVFGVRKLGEIELAARLGYLLNGGALIYGRAGILATDFRTLYVQKETELNVAGYRRGLRLGAGVDFPLGGRLVGRMEYSVSSYGNYDVTVSPGADNFAPNERLMRFGVIYRFAAPATSAPIRPETLRGFYVGAQGGFGDLESRNTGDRKPPQTLDAQRAGSGATGGVFLGYGVTIRRVYLAVEGEAEVSNADWNIKSDPEGRIYSVAKDYTLGAAILAGYVLPGNTLLYGRVGVASTRFDNRYSDEGGENAVAPSVDRVAPRVGGGVSLPLGDRTRLRFDYTWTAYGQYYVNYVSGQDSFRNSEGLMRVGLAVRF